MNREPMRTVKKRGGARRAGSIRMQTALYVVDRPGHEKSIYVDREPIERAIASGRLPSDTTIAEFRRPDGSPWLIAHDAHPDWHRAAEMGLVREEALWEAVNIEYPAELHGYPPDHPEAPRQVVTHWATKEEARDFAYPDMPDAVRLCKHGWTTWVPVGPLAVRADRRLGTTRTTTEDGRIVPSQPFANMLAATMATVAGLRVDGFTVDGLGKVAFSLDDGGDAPQRAKALTQRQWDVVDWAEEDPDEFVLVTLASRRRATPGIRITRIQGTRRVAAEALIQWVEDESAGTERTWTADSILEEPMTVVDFASEYLDAWRERVDWGALVAEHEALRCDD